MGALVVLSLAILATSVACVVQAKDGASDDLLDAVLELKDEVAELKTLSEKQERKYVDLNNEVTELKRCGKNEELQFNELLRNYGDHENEIKELMKNTNEKEYVVGKLRKAVQEQNDSRHVRELRSFQNVAFSVYLTQPQKYTSVGQTVKFDGVQLNEGSGYDPHQGRFVAPNRGLYLFTFTIAKYHAGEARVNLKKNGNTISGAIVDVRTESDDHQAGNVALVELDVGDVVYVEYHEGHTDMIFGHNGYKWTTFTGVWLV